MDKINRDIIIVCEGLSERNYLLEFNRYLRENNIKIVFHPRVSNGGSFGHIIREFKKQRKANPKNKILVWADRDIYERKEKEHAAYDKKLDSIPDFLFNYYSFEDFFAMHLEDLKFEQWNSYCHKNNHYQTPMTSRIAIPLFLEIIPDYKKGTLPDWFSVTQENLQNLFKNQKNDKVGIKSDMASYIETLLD